MATPPEDAASPRPDTCPTFPPPSQQSWWQLEYPGPGRARLTEDREVEVCVVGAGVTGCTAARTLVAGGAEVLLLDSREVAGGASGRNGGFLLAGTQRRFAELLAHLGVERGAAMYQLSVDARDALMALAEELGLVPDHVTRTGSLRLATTPEELAELRIETKLLREHGHSSELLERSALPGALEGHFLGGIRVGGDGCMHPARWVRTLAADAERRGATILEHSPVTSVESERPGGRLVLHSTGGGRVRAETVILCTEAWLPGLVPQLTDRIVPYRSQVLAATVSDREPGATPLLPTPVWSRRGWDYAQQRPDGTLIAGGEEIEDPGLHTTWHESVDESDQRALDRWLRTVLEVRTEVHGRWAGVLSRSSDGLPYLGRLPGGDSLYVAGGWGGAGNVLGFAGGAIVADMLTSEDRRPPEMRVERIS